MKNTRTIAFIFFLIWTVKGFAYTPEEGKVNAILGPYNFRTNFEGSPQGAEASKKTGMALIALGDISDHGSLEIGIFTLPKQYFREYHGGFIGAETSVVHITTGYHFWHSPRFSSSLALFSAYPIGTAVTIHNSLPPGSEAIETSANDNAEYGIEAALQGEIYSAGRYGLVAEARYSFSLTHKDSERADHYGALVGLRYLIQEEKVHEKMPELPK